MVIGPISRRLFMKGIAALAGSKVLPVTTLKALTKESVKKIPYAPPWVSSLVNTLQRAPLEKSYASPFKVGNGARIMNLGSKKIKLFKNKEAKESYFRIQTGDEVIGDAITIKSGDHWKRSSWDDITLREEPDQTTITFMNKTHAGDDQHIVIDKARKETRFVDDNWRMEEGGEDIAKDDWIEWGITTNKDDIAKALKKPVNEIDDAIVDGHSVNDMDNEYADMFKSYVDSFSPSGNIFG